MSNKNFELTLVEGAGLAVFVFSSLFYLWASFCPCFPWRMGVTVFLDPIIPGAPPTYKRWAHVMARSDPALAIQSLRCVIQGATFICGSSLTVVFFCVFFRVATSYQNLLVMIIGALATISLLFFIQNLRLIFHLGFVVMTAPTNKELKKNDDLFRPIRELEFQVLLEDAQLVESVQSDHDHRVSLIGEDRPSYRRYGSLVMAHVTGDDMDLNSTLAACLIAETNMTIEEHAKRIERMVWHSQLNWALGVRALMLLIPPAFGLFGGVPLMVSSVSLVSLLMYLDWTLTV